MACNESFFRLVFSAIYSSMWASLGIVVFSSSSSLACSLLIFNLEVDAQVC